MDRTYWHKQGNEPLFPDLIWSKPENKHSAGKLLIIGGNLHGFAAPGEAYKAAEEAGIGTCRVVLPDSLQKTVGTFLENAFFAPSTPSGSFAKRALAELLEHAAWADGVLLAGDFGRNSETAILLETFLEKYTGPLVLSKDTADYLTSNVQKVLDRENTTLSVSLSQLQHLAKQAKHPAAITFSMDTMQLVDWLHEFSAQYSCNIVTKHHDFVFVAVGGQVSTAKNDQEAWRVETGAKSTVWLIQHPGKSFEAITTALTV